MMGAPEDALEDASWEPEQDAIYDFLCNAPACVHGHISRHDDNTKLIKEREFRDSHLYAT